MVDYYDVLGVDRDAGQEDVERAYREKVKEHHPDVSDHPKAAERFRAVVDAEAVLGDPAERARYDDMGHEAYVRVVGDADDVAADAADDGAAGDGHAGRTGGGATTERARRAARERRRRRRRAEPDGAYGPAAGGDNPSQRGYSPWDGGDGREDGETPFDEDPFAPGDGDRTGAGGPFADEDPFAPGGDDPAGSGEPFGAEGVGHADTGRARREPHGAGGSGDAGGVWASQGPHERPAPSPESTRGRRPIAETVRSQDVQLLSVALLFVYPGFVFFSVAPSMPLAANAVVGAATLAIGVVMLTEPAIAFAVFGFWSFVAPLLLLFLDVAVLSGLGLFVLGVTWGPLALAAVIELARR